MVAWNNITDPVSGIDWYAAAGMLEDMRRANVPIANVRPIPFFENLFRSNLAAQRGQPTNTQAVYSIIARSAVGGRNFTDFNGWTPMQRSILENHSVTPNLFVHPQYTSLFSWGTYAKSDYHAGALTFRQRLGTTLAYDVNYTFSKSMDDASSSGGLILSPLIPEMNYKYSSFDARHMLNANFLFQLPVGKGRRFLSGISSWADAVLGGWQLAVIYRFSTGRPYDAPSESPRRSTNWLQPSRAILTRPLQFKVDRNTGQAFADPVYAMQSFRASRPGEVGSLGVFRTLHTRNLDMTLSKSFTMPWSETHKLQFKWDVFNVANFQQLEIGSAFGSRYSIPIDPDLTIPSDNFGVIFNSIEGTPRRMQFGLRYEF